MLELAAWVVRIAVVASLCLFLWRLGAGREGWAPFASGRRSRTRLVLLSEPEGSRSWVAKRGGAGLVWERLRVGDDLPLDGAVRVGCGWSCELCLQDPDVEAFHAILGPAVEWLRPNASGRGLPRGHALLLQAPRLWMLCHGAAWVNGRRVEGAAHLREGDVVRLGGTDLRFEG